MTPFTRPPADLTSYADVADWLQGLKAGGVKFGIDRMAALVAALDHPEHAVPAVHVGGTNGKGSVCAMVESIARAAGRRTGLYTSPHLLRLGERVQVDRVPLTDGEITAYVRELLPVAARIGADSPDNHPSFFEFMTAMAFLQFARRRCDLAILEVGLGGRLDATNVVAPRVCVITSVALDHCEILGDTVAKIAAEKAGILKPGVPVILGRLPVAAETVVRARAAALGCPVHAIDETFGEGREPWPSPALEGEHQRLNAAMATLVARELGCEADAIARGLATVGWAGRWQRVTVGGRPLILEAAHNPEGAAVLAACLRKLVTDAGRNPVVIVGVLGQERARPLLATIAAHAAEIILVKPQQARACTFEELAALIPADFAGPVRRGTVAELFPGPDACTAGGPADHLLVTGSIYLLGEVLARLRPGGAAGEGGLQDF
ncbi:MAG: folylpolyglutamate synthase/dihydrofolate synthase family protein [Verrucomicrobiota bacterium]